MISVAVTIDVENPQSPLFEKRFSDNRVWSNGYGIEKIIELLDKYGIKGTFFTNVYEYVVWGKKEMERIVKFIHDKGHDVELHTHPIWIDEKRRENMFQFPLKEQEAIIEFGANFIERCTGRRPKCHRAGAYGFNFNTLRACKKSGFLADSSNFYDHPNCKAMLTKNEIVIWEGIVELPVTVYTRENQIMKTDLDCITGEELKTFVEHNSKHSNLAFINFFLHSYSLTKTHDNYRTFEFDREKLNKAEHIFEWLSGYQQAEMFPLAEIAKRNLAPTSTIRDTRSKEM